MSSVLDVVLVTAHGVEVSDQDDAPLLDALRDRGLEVDLWAWHDDVDWSRTRAAVIRTTWDYTDRHEDFLAWCERAADATRLFNPPDVVRWNTHKSYLLELEERGAPIVPTAWLARGDDVDLVALLETQAWGRAVVKPTVDAGAKGLATVTAADADSITAGQEHLDRLLDSGDVMIQPYITSIETEGELSVIVIDGKVTHAVRKLPQEGDFRIQVEWGGTYRPETPDRDITRLAEWIVEATGHDLLYARVDLVFDEYGAPMLGELEATEPSLYLTVVPSAAPTVAAAIERRLP